MAAAAAALAAAAGRQRTWRKCTRPKPDSLTTLRTSCRHAVCSSKPPWLVAPLVKCRNWAPRLPAGSRPGSIAYAGISELVDQCNAPRCSAQNPWVVAPQATQAITCHETSTAFPAPPYSL